MSIARPTPTALDRLIAERLSGHRLVCEVDWEDILPWIRGDWDGLRRSKGNAREVARSYPAMNLVYMVAWGLKKYDHNEFWTDLRLKGSEQRAISEVFEEALTKLDLETFPQLLEEGARRFVTVILAHGGIPASSAGPFLRKALLPALASGTGNTAEELIALWRANPPAVFSKPVERFLAHGGETAVDLLDRLISMVGAPRQDLAADPDAYGVPGHLVKAFLEIPESEVSKAARWPKAEIRLHPFEGSGPQLFVPPLDRDMAQGFSWEIDDGSEEPVVMKGFFRRDVEPIPLLPTDFWQVTARRNGESRLRTIECFGDNPIVSFDETGAYLSDAAGLRGDSVWIVARDGVTLSSVEEGGLRLLDGEAGAFLPAPWKGHIARRYDLRGVHLLSVADGDAEVDRLRVHRSHAGVEFLAGPLRDARSVEGDPVLAGLPQLSLPPGSPWRVVVDAPTGRVERAFEPVDAVRTVDLTEVVEPTLGHYTVTVRGQLGADLVPQAFALVPGLELETPNDPCLPGRGDIVVAARAAEHIGLAGRQPGEAVSVTIAADEDNEELWAWDKKRKQGVIVSVPRLRWAFRAADNFPTFGQERLKLGVHPLDALPEALLVTTSRPDRRLFLRLDDEHGGQLQISTPEVTDGSGRATFDLTHFRETVRGAGRGCTFRLRFGGASVAVIEHAVAAVRQVGHLPHLGDRVNCQVGEVQRQGLVVKGEGWAGFISGGRLRKPLGDYRPGDIVQATVIAIDGLDHLQLEARRFDANRFQLGQSVSGFVVHASDGRVLVDVVGHDAVVGAERLPPDRPPQTWERGMTLTGRVVEINADRHILRLAVAPFIPSRFRRGQAVTGTVLAVTDGGLFVDLGGAVGRVPAHEEASGSRPGVGAAVAAWVDYVEQRRELVMLSMRPYNQAGLKVGDILDVRVRRPMPTAVLVTLPDGCSGWIPRREMLPQLNGSPDSPRPGIQLQAKVIQLDARERQIRLSATAATSTYTFGGGEEESPFAVLKGMDTNPSEPRRGKA